MILLGIETATPQVGCAIGAAEGPLACFHAAKGRRHAESLAPAIEFLCRQTGVDLHAVGVVAVDIGPGLFTGLRVGLATAKAMAAALRVPMIGLTSLDLLAYPLRHTDRLIAVLVDARRGEVFWALYRQVPGGVQRESEYRVSPPAEVASELLARGEECICAGDGALRYSAMLEGMGHVELAGAGHAYPSAATLVELAHPLALREEFVQPAELHPLYLRKADVRIGWSQREPAVGSEGDLSGNGGPAARSADHGGGSVATVEGSGAGPGERRSGGDAPA